MSGPLADGTVLALTALCVIGGAGLVRKGLYGSATIEQKTGIRLVGRYSVASLESGVGGEGSYAAYVVSPSGELFSAGEVNQLWQFGEDDAHDRFAGYETTDDRGEKSPVAFPTLERAAQWLRDQADAAATNESFGYATRGGRAWYFGPRDLEGFHIVRFDPEAYRYSVFRIVTSKGRDRWVLAKKGVAERAIRAVRRGMRKSFRF